MKLPVIQIGDLIIDRSSYLVKQEGQEIAFPKKEFELLYFLAQDPNMTIYRKEFMADIGHELKTPIFAAQGYIHTLLDGAIDNSQIRLRFLKKAAKNKPMNH